jgi:hypothetical protein
VTFTRRPVLDLPLTALSMTDGAAEGDEPVSPGAEFEPVSPLDVPAFLRRQSEG